ncbi:hypothetical protein PMAYCL1PPCAC_33114, partial [Pristionchus mayeri]
EMSESSQEEAAPFIDSEPITEPINETRQPFKYFTPSGHFEPRMPGRQNTVFNRHIASPSLHWAVPNYNQVTYEFVPRCAPVPLMMHHFDAAHQNYSQVSYSWNSADRSKNYNVHI